MSQLNSVQLQISIDPESLASAEAQVTDTLTSAKALSDVSLPSADQVIQANELLVENIEAEKLMRQRIIESLQAENNATLLATEASADLAREQQELALRTRIEALADNAELLEERKDAIRMSIAALVEEREGVERCAEAANELAEEQQELALRSRLAQEELESQIEADEQLTIQLLAESEASGEQAIIDRQNAAAKEQLLAATEEETAAAEENAAASSGMATVATQVASRLILTMGIIEGVREIWAEHERGEKADEDTADVEHAYNLPPGIKADEAKLAADKKLLKDMRANASSLPGEIWGYLETGYLRPETKQTQEADRQERIISQLEDKIEGEKEGAEHDKNLIKLNKEKATKAAADEKKEQGDLERSGQTMAKNSEEWLREHKEQIEGTIKSAAFTVGHLFGLKSPKEEKDAKEAQKKTDASTAEDEKEKRETSEYNTRELALERRSHLEYVQKQQQSALAEEENMVRHTRIGSDDSIRQQLQMDILTGGGDDPAQKLSKAAEKLDKVAEKMLAKGTPISGS